MSSLRINRRSQTFGVLAALATTLIVGCAPPPPKLSNGHLGLSAPSADHAGKVGKRAHSKIPPPIMVAPAPPPPAASFGGELFTVVVNNVPIREMLFALARDADINIDIDPEITGNVSLNAIDQTLMQILSRVEQQADIRYFVKDGTVVVSPDRPYLHHYDIDYVNLTRTTEASVRIQAEVASTGGDGNSDSGGGGRNSANTEIVSRSNNLFWNTLVSDVQAILRGGDSLGPSGNQGGTSSGVTTGSDSTSDNSVIAHPESGILTVKATHRQHREVQHFLDTILEHSRRQVLIESTVVEVTLNDAYQAGVDWQRLAKDGEGISAQQLTLGNNLTTPPFFSLNYTNLVGGALDLTSTVRLLNEFGNTRVLSSPKLMVLNNQTALLKVVDNRVYFTTSVETDTTQGVSTTTFETEVHTVPVGFVMSVTPQISDTDQVIINARPTISRIVGFVNDPNPSLAAAGVESLIPEIQVREVESVLKVQDGEIAVIGGLMQDTQAESTAGLPGLARLPIVSDVTSYKDNQYKKTELIIFLRPVVVKDASLYGDFADYRQYLLPPAATTDRQERSMRRSK